MRISFDQASALQFAPTRESRELALAAIKEAYAQIGRSQQVGAVSSLQETSKREKATPGLFKGLQPPGFTLKSIASLLGLVSIGAVILVWHSNLGRAAPEPPTASIPNAKRDQPAPVASDKLDTTAVAQAKPAVSEPQATPGNTPSDARASASSPELTGQLQSIARDLASVEQGLHQLKVEQSRIVRENAELNEQLKAMREVTRRNVELTEGLKAAQEQTAQEISGLGEQLKANQYLMTTVAGQFRDNQEQAARLAAEQKQRKKLAPKVAASPTGLPPPQASRNLQPRQQ